MTGLPARPRLSTGTRLAQDPKTHLPVLLYPEGVLFLNPTAAAVLATCDGERTLASVLEVLTASYTGVRVPEVVDLLAALHRHGLVTE